MIKMNSYWTITMLTLVGCILTLNSYASFWFSLIISLILVWFAFRNIKYSYERKQPPSFESDTNVSIAILFICVLILSVLIGIPYVYNATVCRFTESCADSWIAANLTGLPALMHEKVFGQHIATSTVYKQIRGHLVTDPKKPLVLSLHGLSGTGKNFVTRIVVDYVYARGAKNECVHYISSSRDFPNDFDVPTCKKRLKTRIETAVAQCPRSFFIINEIDQMPPGVLESLRTYMYHYGQINGVDYRKSILFLLSNTGGDEIVDYVLKRRVARKDLSLKDLEPVIRKAAFEKPNGLQHSSLISNNFISAFVPFLPLERRHVQQCIVEEMLSNGYYQSDHQVDTDKVDIVADEFEYIPNGKQLFVRSGCKLVREKINMILPDY